MKSIEHTDRQPNSFGEIDRILAIAEESKRDFDKTTIEKSFRALISLYLPLVLSVIGVLLAVYELLHEQNLLSQLFFVIPFIIFLYIQIKNSLAYGKLINEKKKKYEAVSSQATEVLREIIPVVSRKENWSAIKKFEVKLRLSKLDISPEGILDDKRL